MGLLGVDANTTSSSDNRQVASDYGQVVGRSGVLLNPDSKAATGKGSTFVESGGINLGKGASLNTGLQLSGMTGNVIIGDTAGIAALSTTFADTLKSFNEQSAKTISDLSASSAATVKSTNAQTANLAESILTSIQGLAESKQTDGESGKNKTILWIVLGVLAVLGWVFYKR